MYMLICLYIYIYIFAARRAAFRALYGAKGQTLRALLLWGTSVLR